MIRQLGEEERHEWRRQGIFPDALKYAKFKLQVVSMEANSPAGGTKGSPSAAPSQSLQIFPADHTLSSNHLNTQVSLTWDACCICRSSGPLLSGHPSEPQPLLLGVACRVLAFTKADPAEAQMWAGPVWAHQWALSNTSVLLGCTTHPQWALYRLC